jgi:hypothetical protein
MRSINQFLSKFKFKISRLPEIPADISEQNHVILKKGAEFDISSEILNEIFAFFDNIHPFYEGMPIKEPLLIGDLWKTALKLERRNQLDFINKRDISRYKELLENMFFNELIRGLWNFHYFNANLLKNRPHINFLALCKLFQKVTSLPLKTISAGKEFKTWGAKTDKGIIQYTAPEHALQAFNIINLLSNSSTKQDGVFTVLDLGSGYGGMAEMLLNPAIKGDMKLSLFLIDIPLNLTTAYAYLSHKFGTDNVTLVKKQSELLAIKPQDGKLWLIPTIFIEAFNTKIDLVNNAQSLSEMDAINVKFYLNTLLDGQVSFFIETNVNDLSKTKQGEFFENQSRYFPVPHFYRLLVRFSAPDASSRYVTSIYSLKNCNC